MKKDTTSFAHSYMEMLKRAVRKTSTEISKRNGGGHMFNGQDAETLVSWKLQVVLEDIQEGRLENDSVKFERIFELDSLGNPIFKIVEVKSQTLDEIERVTLGRVRAFLGESRKECYLEDEITNRQYLPESSQGNIIDKQATYMEPESNAVYIQSITFKNKILTAMYKKLKPRKNAQGEISVKQSQKSLKEIRLAYFMVRTGIGSPSCLAKIGFLKWYQNRRTFFYFCNKLEAHREDTKDRTLQIVAEIKRLETTHARSMTTEAIEEYILIINGLKSAIKEKNIAASSEIMGVSHEEAKTTADFFGYCISDYYRSFGLAS